MTDIVATAAAAIDYDAWTKTEDGELVPQITTDITIHGMLRLLDIQPGMNVMEIGTGSGYSGALSSRIVGDAGRVVSIDIDADLVERASALHAKAGHTNIEVHASDGFLGWAPAVPFDRIVGWTTPHVVPSAWVEQAVPGAVIVTPVKIADVAGANALVRCTVHSGLRDGELHPGNFIEMAPEVITEFALPVRYVNAVHRVEGAAPWWISAHLLHEQPPEVAERLLAQVREAKLRGGFFDGGRDRWDAFNAFVLASTKAPASLGGANGWGIGVATTDSIAVLLRNGALVAAGTDQAQDELAELFAEWHDHGEPGYSALEPEFAADADGWTVRPKLRRER